MANTIGELNVEIGAKLDKLERGLSRMEKSIGQAGKQSEKTASQSFSKVGGIIAGAFSIQAISSFTRAVIEVRSEFEKFEAVLTNTLGSSSAAQLALADIKDMAAMTPFSVAELSGAFVKLTNYGLKPSMEAMRQYGDLASAVGKGFDQLAEAVADATTGEFERLKEFGIKSKKEGDKVTFTFKEQATQVDFTADAIENYITSLGDLEGVSGSMAAISETLGGKVSNLGDRFDSLLNTIGDTSAWGAVIDALGETLSGTEALIKGLQSDIGGVPWYEKMAMLFSTTGAQAQLAVMAAQQDALDKTALKAEVAAEQTDDLTEKTNELSEAEKLAAFNTRAQRLP
jgi:phage tail tape-measure protein